MMASMEDLVATLSGGMHVGREANDLKDLHAKLAQTLHPALPPHPQYRPIPTLPPAANIDAAPHTSAGPLPPPAPASSWNSPPPQGGYLTNPNANLNSQSFNFNLTHSGGSPRQMASGENYAGLGGGGVRSNGKRDVGFSVPPPVMSNSNSNSSNQNQDQDQNQNQSSNQQEYRYNTRARGALEIPGSSRSNANQHRGSPDMPYHGSVLPIQASPMDTGGFADDAFKPLWDENEQRLRTGGGFGPGGRR